MSGELPGKAVESCPFMPLDHPLVVEIRRRLNPNNEFEFLVNQIKRCVKEGSVTDFKQHLSTREYSPPGQVALINKCVKAGRLECLKEMSNEFNIHPVFLAEAGPEGTFKLRAHARSHLNESIRIGKRQIILNLLRRPTINLECNEVPT